MKIPLSEKEFLESEIACEDIDAWNMDDPAFTAVAAHPSKEQHMTCKHRWEPSNFAAKHRAPNHYMYQCQRCWKTISAILKEKQNGN